MTIEWKNEWCKCCERPNKIGFHVTDRDWKGIVPPEYQESVLCYNCFEMFAYIKQMDFTLLGLYPVARINIKTVCYYWDNKHQECIHADNAGWVNCEGEYLGCKLGEPVCRL